MNLESKLTNLRQRLADLAARFDSEARARWRMNEEGWGAFGKALRNLRELFTAGVTREGLADLIRREPRETFATSAGRSISPHCGHSPGTGAIRRPAGGSF